MHPAAYSPTQFMEGMSSNFTFQVKEAFFNVTFDSFAIETLEPFKTCSVISDNCSCVMCFFAQNILKKTHLLMRGGVEYFNVLCIGASFFTFMLQNLLSPPFMKVILFYEYTYLKIPEVKIKKPCHIDVSLYC